MLTYFHLLFLVCFLSLLALLYGNFSYLLRSKVGKVDSNGVERRYVLHIPSKKSETPQPLVIVLHGYGDHPQLIEFYSQWSRKADKEGFFVAYPEGSTSSENSRRSWNAGSCCGSALKNNVDDLAFIKQVIETLGRDERIDSTKIFITGFSNGALMAQRVASELPNSITAVSSVAGSIGGKVSESQELFTLSKTDSPLPILLIHGDADTVVPYNGGLNQYSDAEFYSVSDSALFWATNNRCILSPTVLDEQGMKQEIYSGCADNSEVVLTTIRNLQHTWPGSIQDKLMGRKLKAFSATDMSWDFFRKHI